MKTIDSKMKNISLNAKELPFPPILILKNHFRMNISRQGKTFHSNLSIQTQEKPAFFPF
jgi:hypothetical protein